MSLDYPILPWVNPSSGPSSTALPVIWGGEAALGFCYWLCSTTPLRARWPPHCVLCGSTCCGQRSSVSGWTERWFHRSLCRGALSKSFRFWCTRSLRTVASCQYVMPWRRSDTAAALPDKTEHTEKGVTKKQQLNHQSLSHRNILHCVLLTRWCNMYFSMLITVFVLTSCDDNTRKRFYFRSRFYFCDVAAGTT